MFVFEVVIQNSKDCITMALVWCCGQGVIVLLVYLAATPQK